MCNNSGVFLTKTILEELEVKRDEIHVIFQNEIDCARLYWVQVSWWQWVLQGLCEERPELSHASLIWLQWPHRQPKCGTSGERKIECKTQQRKHRGQRRRKRRCSMVDNTSMLQPVESPGWSRFVLQDYCLQEEPTLEAGEKSQEKGVAERS